MWGAEGKSVSRPRGLALNCLADDEPGDTAWGSHGVLGGTGALRGMDD